jgi:uncharacterized protein YbjT (DUF2867 family)
MKCLVFGATGLTGKHLVDQLLKQGHEVHCIVRNKGTTKGIEHLVDFEKEIHTSESNFDVVFNCLGTTIKKAKNKENFFRVDHDYVLDAFNYALSTNSKKFCSISALGAKSDSMFFYNQVKGKIEEKLSSDNIEVIIVRPGLLVGKREEFRLLEKLSITLFQDISKLFPKGLKKYAPVKASIVAETLIELALTGETSSPLEHIIK